VPGSGFQGWQFGGGAIKGKPSVSAGMDGAAYVAGRDSFNAIWLGRVQGNLWTGWSFGGGVSNSDPLNARVGNRSYVVFLDTGGATWYRAFLEGTTTGWEASWTSEGGALETIAPAGSGVNLYVVGQDLSNALWWNQANPSQWSRVGGQAQGIVAAGPR
jgi:hypothetical protein